MGQDVGPGHSFPCGRQQEEGSAGAVEVVVEVC